MGRRQNWFRALVVPLVLLAILALPGNAARTPRGSIGIDLAQCQNRMNGTASPINNCTGAAWHYGNLNHNNSLYREGDYVPMRSIITGTQDGQVYTLRIGYDAVQRGLHAYDYLGDVDGSIRTGQQIVPCINAPPTLGTHRCGEPPSLLLVPKDTPNVPAGNPGTVFPPLLNGSQADGHFSAWGAKLTSAAYFHCTPATSASHPCGPIGVPGQADYVPREVDITFTANGPSVVLAWGAHIASSLDWGAGRTFISAGGGASFHMRLKQIHLHACCTIETTGNKEVSLQAAALAPQPRLLTDVAPPSVTSNQTVIDTATLSGVPNRPVTGEVQFFICGPHPSDPPDCSLDGDPVGLPQVVTASGEATIQFPQPGQGPLATGHYCFRAEYTPSETAEYSPVKHSGGPPPLFPNECFVVTQPPPRLTVTKLCDPVNDPGLFNLLVDDVVFGGATNVGCGHVEGPHDVAVGTRTVSETAGTGTSLANYTTTIGGNCTPTPANPTTTGSVTLALGDEAVCTITNTRNPIVPAMLTVHKVCVPSADTGNFNILVNDDPVAVLGCGESTEEPIRLAPGTYTVREASGADTSLSDYTTVISGDCNPQTGSITLTEGQLATCTFTNTRIPAPTTTLEVVKACDPPGDSGHFNLTIETTNGHRVHQVAVPCGGTTHPVKVEPGGYRVFETGANGTDLSHYNRVVGGDCEADGTVEVAAGDEAKCLITNVRRGTPFAQLTVTKICVPRDDGGRFNLTVDGQTSRDVACGHSFGPVAVPPGQHHVSESAGTGTSLSDYTRSIGGSCAPDGTVTLTAGQQATCTITNVRAREATGTVEIQKQCSPAGRNDRFSLDLAGHIFRGIACGHSTGPVVIGVGNHRVGEVATDEITSRFRTAISGGCSPSGSFTLGAGQHVTCVITNTLVPFRPAPRPPLACYRLTVAPRMVRVGKRVPIVAHVHLGRRPIPGVRVYAAGRGVSVVQTTGPRGRAVFVLRLRHAGILRMTIRRPYLCPPRLPKKIGVLGRIQPFLTG